MHLTKNYNTDGGDRTVIGGVLEFEQGAEVKNFPDGGSQGGKAENQQRRERKQNSPFHCAASICFVASFTQRSALRLRG